MTNEKSPEQMAGEMNKSMSPEVPPKFLPHVLMDVLPPDETGIRMVEMSSHGHEGDRDTEMYISETESLSEKESVYDRAYFIGQQSRDEEVAHLKECIKFVGTTAEGHELRERLAALTAENAKLKKARDERDRMIPEAEAHIAKCRLEIGKRALLEARVSSLTAALEKIAKYDPNKGLVKVMPMRAVAEMHGIASEALKETQ